MQRGRDRSPIAIGGYEMSSFAEAVIAILVIAVIGLAIRNGKLKREKELLFKQLRRMRDKEERKNPELAATQETAEVQEIETGHSCPNCKSGLTEIYERSRDQEGWICRACNHTWLVLNPPRYSPVVPSGKSRWTYTIRNTSCPDCGCVEFEMRTYGGPWEYADTHCASCGKLIRRFDAA